MSTKVRLISYSQICPETFQGQESELKNMKDLVAFCARVSNPSNQMNSLTADKLVKYLISHKHFSPLEMVSACVEVECTRDIARQLLRHRSFSFQEFSQRYADPTKEMTFVTRDARLQDKRNRQNSIETDDASLDAEWKIKQQAIIDLATDAYKWAVENNIAKEQARAVLPEGLTMSRLYVNGTLRSYLHYIEVRSANGTQKEHIELAVEVAKVISKIFPMG